MLLALPLPLLPASKTGKRGELSVSMAEEVCGANMECEDV